MLSGKKLRKRIRHLGLPLLDKHLTPTPLPGERGLKNYILGSTPLLPRDRGLKNYILGSTPLLPRERGLMNYILGSYAPSP